MASSPTQRTLEECRKRGWHAEVVERWNPHARVRNDLFGFIDVLAITPDGETVGIQATSYGNASARVRKITEHANLPAVRLAGWKVLVWGWRKVGARWQVREIDLS